MKKILILMLASALLLTSCGGKNNGTTNNTSNNNASNGNDTTMNDTLGDENGNGKVEDGHESKPESESKTESESESESSSNGNDSNGNSSNGNMNGGESSAEGEVTASAVTSVTSAEDAVTFIDVNVYSQCTDVLPMSTMSTIIPFDDMDIVSYNTGLTDLTGITDIIVSESMIGSFAYSLVMVRTDGTNTEEIQTALGEQINPAKWVCVQADKIQSVRLDNDIILVMSDNDRTKPIMDAVVSAAEGVYSEIGSVVNVLG